MANAQPLPFQPRGGNLEFFCSREPEVLNSGPAGSGKTLTALKKIDFLCCKYPGIRALIIRKTRASMTESTLVTYETGVLPEGSKILDGVQRRNRSSYRYPNGSEVIVAGLDDPQKVYSTEFTIAYLNEAVNFTESEYETILSRIRFPGMPYRMLMADTNPSHSKHWLKRRSETERVGIDGKPTGKPMVRLIKTTLRDNPRFWDEVGRCYTQDGLDYLNTLPRSGVLHDRLVLGEWTSAEGVVFPEFDPNIHVIPRDRLRIPADWPRYMSIDWGFRSPMVCLWLAVNPQDNTMYITREYYQSEGTTADHAKEIKRLSGIDPIPQAIVCDHDPERKLIFEAETGWSLRLARKDKPVNIEEIRSRLVLNRYGVCGLYLFDDCLVRRDDKWFNAGNASCLAEEFVCYHWKKPTETRSPKEEPMDKDDHGCDALGYACAMIANHYGEWKGQRNLPAAPEPMVLARDPVGSDGRVWFPFPRLTTPNKK